MNIPIAILRGVEISLPRFANPPKMAMMTGVSAITKNGLIACHTSGATADESTKSVSQCQTVLVEREPEEDNDA